MARPRTRIAAIQAALFAGLVVVLARAAYLQLVKGDEYAGRALRQRTETRALQARRGTIYDRNQVPLAESLEHYHLAFAPDEFTDTTPLVRIATRDLHIRGDRLSQRIRSGAPWLYYHGPFTASQVEQLRRRRGVHLEPVSLRAYPLGPLARPVVGAVESDSGGAVSGIELALDSLLAGRPGSAVFLRDPRGRLFESPGRKIRDPVAGHDVVLTIDAMLQAIAENALQDALREMDADGGDVVFLEPRTGELLALASRTTRGPGATASFFTSGFEPGSTLKPFTAAALLALDRVRPNETVAPEDGAWIIPVRGTRPRRIEDAHAEEGPLTLERAIKVSSNIGVGKFSQRLRPEEHYQVLRDFGFGSPTGVEFPAEAAGRLPRPDGWQPLFTGLSLAIGYEILVTPVQLAMAYAALANDGVLVAPTLIREIRSPEGRTLYRHRPEVVRQVVTPRVAATIRGFLASAAGEGGTGRRGQLRFGVLGKTGTARLLVDGRYSREHHAASFAGIFPAEDPQLAFVVRVENPQGDYYGGLTAAPLLADMLRQALAARQSAIDRRRLADAAAAPARSAPDGSLRAEPEVRAVPWPLLEADSATRPAVRVPDLTGRGLREAALALHRRGFRVRVEGGGRVLRSVPTAGESLPAGRVVTLFAAPEPPRP